MYSGGHEWSAHLLKPRIAVKMTAISTSFSTTRPKIAGQLGQSTIEYIYRDDRQQDTLQQNVQRRSWTECTPAEAPDRWEDDGYWHKFQHHKAKNCSAAGPVHHRILLKVSLYLNAEGYDESHRGSSSCLLGLRFPAMLPSRRHMRSAHLLQLEVPALSH